MKTTEQKSESSPALAVTLGSPAVALEVFRRGRRYLRFQPHGYESPIELPVITCGSRDEGMDHDWQEKSDSTGECDGHPGQHWTWRECRVCGARDDEEDT